MGRREDLDELDASSPWNEGWFRHGLAQLSDSTVDAARRYADDVIVLAGLARGIPRCADDDRGGTPWTSFRREVAVARTVSDRAAGGEIRDALRLTSALVGVLELLKNGSITVQRARVFVHEVETYDDDLAELIENELILDLPRMAPWRIAQQVRQAAARLDADAAALRAAAARTLRDVQLIAHPDEQATVEITGPAVPLTRWYRTLDKRARALRAAGDPRSLAALRFDLATSTFPCTTHPPADTSTREADDAGEDSADASSADGRVRDQELADQELAAAGLRPGAVEPASTDCRMSRPVQANIVVPVETSLGLSNEPGWLDGYGWLSAPTSRTLLLDAELRRVCAKTTTGDLVDLADHDLRPPPTPGAVRDTLLAMIRARDDGQIPMSDTAWRTEPQHDPSPALRELISLRERTCDGPTGRSTPASTAELDHDTPWPHGPTAAWNLVARSTRTHQLKHRGWAPVRTPEGTIWFSPAGQIVPTLGHRRPPPGTDDPGAARLPDPDDLAALDHELLREIDEHDRPPWNDPPPF